jgi:UDP-N-acetylmuramoyl-tripeptide--D-alanyl-D-alanine ligase
MSYLSRTTLPRLAELFEGVGNDLSEAAATGFALDSREVRPGDLFLAIRGANVDGHDFVTQALANGAIATLAERSVPGPHILIPNLVDALAKMALHFRQQFGGKVVGITGSVGKTTTKEFVAAALSPLGKVAQTTGNRNTEYTAPLLWAEMEGDEKAAVVEMGMRGFGQIRHLASFARPQIGLITNVGHSHLEVVGSRQGIAEAKAELFEALPSDGLAVAWAGDDFLGLLRAQAPCPVATFGFRSGEAQVVAYEAASWTLSRATISVYGQIAEVEIPAAGRHLALNAAAALLVADACDVGAERAADALSAVRLPEMRMEVLDRGGATLVLDAYNAAPGSFKAALEALAEIPCSGERVVVMGEMKELGSLTEQAHREVGRAIVDSGAMRACFFGEATRSAMDECRIRGMREEALAFAEEIGDVRRFLETIRAGDTVLIKGSRAMGLERALEHGEALR